jgi:hypothetical protein
MKDAVHFAESKDLPTYIMATYTCLSPMISLLSFEEENSIKEAKHIGSGTIPLLPRHAKPVRGQRKRHIF